MNNNSRDDEFLKKRKIRQRKIRRRRIKIFLILFLFLIIITGIVLSLTVFFKIESISASGSSKYTAEQIISAAGIKKGDNLFVSSVNDEKLKTKLSYIDKITVKRKLPGTVTLKVTDAKEYISYFSGDKYYPVSEAGRVLDCLDEKPEKIPEIRAGGITLKVGEKIKFAKEKTEKTLAEIFENAETVGVNINSVDITDELSITVGVENRFSVNFGSSNYIDKKFAHLAGMIKNMDASAAGKVNLSMWTPSNTEGSFVSSVLSP